MSIPSFSSSTQPLAATILVSGRGSNMRALLEHSGAGVSYKAVISNVPDAPALEHAARCGFPTKVLDHRAYATRLAFDEALDEALVGCQTQLVVLAGFMRLLTPWFAERWRDRAINIHPSLLPAFPGLHTHRHVLDYGAKVSGCTVHFVRAAMDHGPIIAQRAVPVQDDDTEETLAARVLEAEHSLYPKCVRWIAEGRVNVLDEKVFIG